LEPAVPPLLVTVAQFGLRRNSFSPTRGRFVSCGLATASLSHPILASMQAESLVADPISKQRSFFKRFNLFVNMRHGRLQHDYV